MTSEKINTPLDRVTYSFGRKLTDDNFGSVEFFASYSTEVDALQGETPNAALKRAKTEVEGFISERLKDYKEKKRLQLQKRQEKFEHDEKELDAVIHRKKAASQPTAD